MGIRGNRRLISTYGTLLFLLSRRILFESSPFCFLALQVLVIASIRFILLVGFICKLKNIFWYKLLTFISLLSHFCDNFCFHLLVGLFHPIIHLYLTLLHRIFIRSCLFLFLHVCFDLFRIGWFLSILLDRLSTF